MIKYMSSDRVLHEPFLSEDSREVMDWNLRTDIVEPIVNSYKRMGVRLEKYENEQQQQQTFGGGGQCSPARSTKPSPTTSPAKKIRTFLKEAKNFETAWQLADAGENFVHLEAKWVDRNELRERWAV